MECNKKFITLSDIPRIRSSCSRSKRF